MTVRELLKTITCDLYITFGEDPNFAEPDIKLFASLAEPEEILGESILNHKVHLTTAKNNAVYISLFLDND